MQETLLAVVKEKTRFGTKFWIWRAIQDETISEFMGRWEKKEGSSMIELLNGLFKCHLALLEGFELCVQRAHRAVILKSTTASSPRSIIVNFFEFQVKELVLMKVWQQKIEINSKIPYQL